MKDFVREHPLISLCGLNCGLCTMHLGGHCPGCGGGEGNQSCAIARCSQQHGGVAYCWQCGEFPCRRFGEADAYDSFVPCRGRHKDIERARRIGEAAYLAELDEKIRILQFLLDGFNDGRKKSFYCAAMCFLDLEEIRTVMAELTAREDVDGMERKERAAVAADLFRRMAAQRGVELKLRRRPGYKRKTAPGPSGPGAV